MKSKTTKLPETKLLNSKEANFTEELSIHSKDHYNGTFKYWLRRASNSELFFKGLDNQIANQLLYNTEEKEAYFLNEKKRLFKLKFEPVNVGERTAEEVLKHNLKEKLRKLIIPWNKFYCLTDFRFSNGYCLALLNRLFVDLLHIVKEKEIKVQCGIGMMNVLGGLGSFDSFRNKIKISNCTIITELDFNVGKHDLVYNGIVLIGEDIEEKEEIKKEESKPKKKFLGIF